MCVCDIHKLALVLVWASVVVSVCPYWGDIEEHCLTWDRQSEWYRGTCMSQKDILWMLLYREVIH